MGLFDRFSKSHRGPLPSVDQGPIQAAISEAEEFNAKNKESGEAAMTGDPYADSLAVLGFMTSSAPDRRADINLVIDVLLEHFGESVDQLATPTGEPARLYLSKCFVGNKEQLDGDRIQPAYHYNVMKAWVKQVLPSALKRIR